MEKMIGIIGITLTPIALLVWLVFILLLLPIVIIADFLSAIKRSVAELFHFKNSIMFLQGWFNKCHRLATTKRK